jgi:hypothetical protein
MLGKLSVSSIKTSQLLKISPAVSSISRLNSQVFLLQFVLFVFLFLLKLLDDTTQIAQTNIFAAPPPQDKYARAGLQSPHTPHTSTLALRSFFLSRFSYKYPQVEALWYLSRLFYILSDYEKS